jgi:hypothetical protein
MSGPIQAFIINESRGPETVPEIIKEEKNIVRFKVDTLQVADVQNRNTRVYEWKDLQEGCGREFIQERLKTGTLYCEIGHPQEKTIERQSFLDRKNASCILKSIDLKKPVISGIVETMDTVLGRDLKGIILSNKAKTAFSMRGIGKIVERKGKIFVKSPLHIFTWDEVVHPSVSSAYMGEILTEADSGVVYEENSSGILTVVNENAFAKYIFDSSTAAQNTADAMGLEVEDNGANLVINENGTIAIKGENDTLVILAESYIRREITDYYKNFSFK